MADGELSQLDERLREVAESLAAIGTSVKTLEGQMGTMNKALFQGNGHPSLMTRVEVLELGQTSFAKQCSDCKAIVLTGSKSEDAEEQRTLIVVERWKAITAIVTAALASPVIIAVLAALLK